MLGEAGKQEILQQMFRLKSSSEQIFSENCRWLPLIIVSGELKTMFTHNLAYRVKVTNEDPHAVNEFFYPPRLASLLFGEVIR